MEESIFSYNMRGKYDLFMCEDLEEKDADELLAKVALEKQQEKLKKDKERKENAAKQKTEISKSKPNTKKDATQKENKGPSKPQSAQPNANDGNKPPRFQKAHENKTAFESGLSQGGRGGSSRGGFVRQFDELEHAPLTENDNREKSERGRGRGRGGFSSRGRGGSSRGGRRDFDRHSGSDKTGVKPTDKREGGGAHNWGTVQDDIDSAVVEEAETSVLVPTTEAGDEENAEQDANANTEDKEQEKQMTLEEWKAKRNQEKNVLAVKLTPSQNLRKANEGKDPFADMVAYRKPKEHQDSDAEEDLMEESQKKPTLPINIRFYDQARRGSDRRRGGDRAGPVRGGRGGHAQSNQAQKSANIQLDSENDFPALK